MPVGDGWYLYGPLIAVALIATTCWTLGLLLADGRDDGLDIFGETEDWGLLSPVAVADEPGMAGEIRTVLAAAGIRSTEAVHHDGRVAVLVFADQMAEARRLVGDLPAL